jgi:hypothetical protein
VFLNPAKLASEESHWKSKLEETNRIADEQVRRKKWNSLVDDRRKQREYVVKLKVCLII